MKKFIIMVVLVIVAIGSFYGGVAFVTSQNNQDAETVIVSAIEDALRSSNQPIIHIIPKESLYEKSKGLLGFKAEREVVVIQSSDVELLLGLKKAEEVGFLKSGLDFTIENVKGVWTWTTSHVGNVWGWTKSKF